MKTHWIAILSILLASASAGAQDSTSARQLRIAEPVQHQNLAVFLIHGDNASEYQPESGSTLAARPQLLTLQEAMDQKLLLVHETSDVNELSVENTSAQHEVFIQSGDIVKGGKQDRVLSVGIIVPPRSGKVPIEAYCVESGRWEKRANESTTRFASSNDRIVSRDLKLAANQQGAQSAVWEKVAQVQSKLSDQLGSPVSAKESQTSLQLSLENKQLSASIDDYQNALTGLLDSKSDVIGYAFAINGKLNSADIYASNDLFKKLWPKLLKASATEALAELNTARSFADANTTSNSTAARSSPADVRALIDGASGAAAQERAVSERVKLITRESKDDIMFETHDASSKTPVHQSFVRKN